MDIIGVPCLEVLAIKLYNFPGFQAVHKRIPSVRIFLDKGLWVWGFRGFGGVQGLRDANVQAICSKSSAQAKGLGLRV